MGDTESIRVVVIHPSPLLRRGVRLTLEDEPDLAVVGEFGRAEPAAGRVPAVRLYRRRDTPSSMGYNRNRWSRQ